MFTVTLDEELVKEVKRGVPNLAIARLRDSGGLEPGRPVRLVEPAGKVIGSGVADPENDLIRVYVQRDIESALTPPLIEARVAEAIALRRALGLVGSGGAYRVLNGEGDQLAGFSADVYGDWAVLYCYAKGLWTIGRTIADALKTQLGVRGVVQKLRPKGGLQSEGKAALKQDIIGEEPPEALDVVERGLRKGELDVTMEVHLLAGLNVGLFCDMRDHRRGLVRFVHGRRVLNTFCYTGALSVAAARFGATQVVSVDLSGGVLKWAAENFRKNGLDPAQHRFETADVMRFCEREHKAGERYGMVILDPPTHSAARSHNWSLERDMPELISRAAQLLEPNGFLWVSSNRYGGPPMLGYLEEGLRRSKRRGRILEHGGLPPDFPTIPQWPEGRYLEVYQVAVA